MSVHFGPAAPVVVMMVVAADFSLAVGQLVSVASAVSPSVVGVCAL